MLVRSCNVSSFALLHCYNNHSYWKFIAPFCCLSKTTQKVVYDTNVVTYMIKQVVIPLVVEVLLQIGAPLSMHLQVQYDNCERVMSVDF